MQSFLIYRWAVSLSRRNRHNPNASANKVCAAGQRDVPGHTECGDQSLRQPFRRHVAEALPGQPPDPWMLDGAPREGDLAGARGMHAGDPLPERGLAGIQKAADPDDLARPHLEIGATIGAGGAECGRLQHDFAGSGRTLTRLEIAICRPFAADHQPVQHSFAGGERIATKRPSFST
jgi:hypothetical protein